MSRQSASAAATNPSSALRGPLQTLREALQLFWTVADRYAKRRLLLALTLVAGGALLAAITPVALRLATDSLTEVGRGQAYLAPIAFVAMYVIGQYLHYGEGQLFARADEETLTLSREFLRAHGAPRGEFTTFTAGSMATAKVERDK